MLGALAMTAGFAREVLALTACTSADIIAQDPMCPSGTGPCTIAKTFTIANGCVLDFGTRAVAVKGTLDVGSRNMTLKAGSLTVASGGKMLGLGNSAPPGDHGGMIVIQTTGAVLVDKAAANGVIDVSGDTLAGAVLIQAGGSVTLKGRLLAQNSTSSGGGGTITIRAGGDFISFAASDLLAGGSPVNVAGAIDIVAGGRVDLGEKVDLVGGDGGVLDVEAGADAVTRTIDADATGDAGSGGCIGIAAGTGLQLLGLITANGAGGTFMSGGCGGFGCFESRYGDLTIAANVLMEGNVPDGGGGDLGFISRGSINVASGTTVSVRASGDMGCGGDLGLDAFFDVVSGGILDTSGGFGGGFLDVSAGRDVTVSGRVDASGRAIAGYGGGAIFAAGQQGKGSLLVQNAVNVSGGSCSVNLGCGLGGITDLSGCDVTLTAAGSLLADGPTGGENDITAREQLTILGSVDATTTGGTAPADGVNRFTYPSRKPPSISGTVTPAPAVTALPTCTSASQTGCLVPCPTCGNGVVEFPETCDTAGTPQGCDGCSVFCQVEDPSCNDANVCTTDSCAPSLGCRHAPVPDRTSCSDGNVCNGDEKCGGGICLRGRPLNCSDGNPCTLDLCDPVGGCQGHTPAPGTPCNDNNPCTVGDVCDAAATCQPGSPLICNDGRECTIDTCNPTSGCVFTPRAGSCTDDGNPCTDDVCAGRACTHPAKPDTTPCDDGSFCTLNEACRGGICRDGTPRNCDDGDPCTTDTCDVAGQTCVHTPVNPCSTTTTTATSSTTSTLSTTSSTSTSTSTTRSTTSTRPPTTSSTSTSTSTSSSTTHTTTSTSTSTSTSSSTTSSSSSSTTSSTTSSSSSSTRPPTTTTSTEPPNPCIPADCNDANPCTADTCAADGCHHVPLTGFDAARCIFLGAGLQAPVCQGQSMPTTITRLFDTARGLIDRGAQSDPASPKKAKGFVRKAAKALKKDDKLVTRAAKKRTISPDCAAALTNLLTDATNRAQQLLGTL
jgi:hypothetical protein